MTDEKPKARPGWYNDPNLASTKRYWDGEGWTEQRHSLRWKPAPLKFGDRPTGLIVASLLLALGLGFLAGAFFFVSEEAGIIAEIVVLGFCSIVFNIGVIAKGVELGIRAARHRPDLDF